LATAAGGAARSTSRRDRADRRDGSDFVNRQIRNLGLGLMLLFTALFVQINLVQVVRADQYDRDPGNNRAVVRDFIKPRGNIITADHVIVAESVPSNDRYRYQRRYPTGDLFGNITGYFSFTLGSTQLEKTQNDVLSGNTAALQLQGLKNLFNDRVNTGDVVLSLRSDIQRVAKQALGNREGSVVVLDPRNGAIKALWSYPSNDPNLIADHSFDKAKATKQFYDAAPGKPLLANSYQERYLPGSTYKVMTATAALESGKYNLTSEFPPTNNYTPPQTTHPIHNYGGTTCGGNFIDVFRRSCNTAFAQIAVNVGAPDMVATAERYGFNGVVPFDLPKPAASVFGTVESFKDNTPLLALGGFGEGNTQVTPLQMALVASAVANGGNIMVPHVVDRTVDRDGKVLSQTQPKVWRRALQPSTASTMRDLMIQVVNNGTARCCMQLANGVQAAAKTGTAQLNPEGAPPASHAWIIAFAPAQAPRYAIAVMVKAAPEVTAGTGGTVAGPIAKQVLDFALSLPDTP
jgi:peptidoglycan glycosyltransferase